MPPYPLLCESRCPINCEDLRNTIILVLSNRNGLRVVIFRGDVYLEAFSVGFIYIVVQYAFGGILFFGVLVYFQRL